MFLKLKGPIRTVKDRYRCAYHSLPFQAIPKIMIKALAKRVVKFLNMFPLKGGVSDYWSPCAIVTGRPLDCKTSCICSFGTFVQAENEPNLSNTLALLSLDGI